MDILLRDDDGFSHPVLKHVTLADIPDLLAQAKLTCADLGHRFGYEPPPIEALQAGRMAHAARFSTRCGRSRTWCGRFCGRLASGWPRRPEPPLPIVSANALAATRWCRLT